jgi:hypothetical protein
MNSPEHKESPARTRGLIPIAGVDFKKPWAQIVPLINEQLDHLRYEIFEPKTPHQAVICNLNKSNPVYPLDPVRVDSDVLGENFSAVAKATAKLGLENIYWEGLTHVVPFQLFYDKWQDFSVLPVFKKGSKYFLMEGGSKKSVTGIQMGGDGDMTSALQNGIIYTKIGNVSIETLGISKDLADTYVDLRNNISAAETIAQNNAVIELRKSSLWPTIQSWFPNADAEFGAQKYFPFMFLSQVEELVGAKFPDITSHEDNEFAETFRQNLTVDFGALIHNVTRLAYGRSLGDDTDFLQHINNLARVTEDLYWSAADTYYLALSHV